MKVQFSFICGKIGELSRMPDIQKNNFHWGPVRCKKRSADFPAAGRLLQTGLCMEGAGCYSYASILTACLFPGHREIV